MFGQKHLLIDKSSLSGVIVGNTVVIVIDAGAAHIGGSSYCGATCATSDDFRFKMIYGDRRSPPLPRRAHVFRRQYTADFIGGE